MEPIFLEPAFKDYIWGGNKLKTLFGKNSPYDITAESWEISTNKNGQSVIANGENKGKTLGELFENHELREAIFGTKTSELDKFPLLVKFIDANSNLSVQVHPDDKYAYEHENGEKGKTEMWYIMECKEGAQIICGIKESVRKEDLPQVLNSPNVAEYLNFVQVNQGDCIYIPSGTVHAIMGDTLICEVQQNSDLTYRVYDWGRVGKDGKPRELHVQKAIDVANVGSKPEIKETNNWQEGEHNMISSQYFKTDKITVCVEFNDCSNKDSFYAMNVVKGEGKIKVQDKEYNLKLGDSFIIPAKLGEYTLCGNMELLKSYL
ncbi:MAG: class I mannose-6-phosphate isomerase [Clostridia bacterium]|nr:class I mannose-6-phosphate isomerase [Clostridia bacterium]